MKKCEKMSDRTKKLDEGQLDLMWTFLQFGKQKSNVPALKELCEQLRTAMIQKTAGQEGYGRADDVSFDDIGTIVNSIVIETMCLYLSGDLDKLDKGEEISPNCGQKMKVKGDKDEDK